MTKNNILTILLAVLLAGGTAEAQQRSSTGRGAAPGAASATLAETETKVKAMLEQLAVQLQRAQQMTPEERVNMLREVERALVKLQEASRPDSAIANVKQLVEELQNKLELVGAARRLVVRQSTLGGGLNVLVGGGAWWTDAALTARLDLTEDQKARIERAFATHRLSLEASRDNLLKEEDQLSRLLDAEPLDRNAITAQVYRVTNARGEVERQNAAMTLDMREQMTRAQWDLLQELAPRATVTLQVPVSPIQGGGGRGQRGRR